MYDPYVTRVFEVWFQNRGLRPDPCVSGVVPESMSQSCVTRVFEVWFQSRCLRPDPCVSGVVPEPAHQVAEEARRGNGDGKEEARAGGGHGEHLGPRRRLHQ